jgi:hypothetical protein
VAVDYGNSYNNKTFFDVMELIMDLVKSNSQTSPLVSLLHCLGISLLTSAGVSVVLVAIVLLLSSVA